MDENYVVNRNQVLKNFNTLLSYRNSTDTDKIKYYKQKLKSGKTFIVEIINNKVEFAPSKFVGYKNNTFRVHDKHYAIDRSGHLTDQNFRRIYGKRLQYDDLLDLVLQSFYSKHGISGTTTKPKARLHYFIDPKTFKQIEKSNWKIPEFFKSADIIKYSSYAGEPYRKKSSKDKKVGREIRERLYDKTNYWLDSISVPGFIKESNTQWQIMGKFAAYTWGRIFKEKDRKQLIYFTVGVDYPKQALIYKLDCQTNRPSGGKKLSKEQLSKFRSIVKRPGPGWIQIDLKQIEKMNWPELIKRTNSFITKNEKLYDDVIKYVWGNKTIPQQKNSLLVVDPPDPQTLPPFLPSFIPKRSNFIKKYKTSSKIGNAGELLEMQEEKKRLSGKLKPGMKIEHISKDKGDGAGYDIKSFDEDGNEIYIEVKTTTAANKNLFFNITPNELEFSKKKNKSFWLYRVYNFNLKNKTGKIYYLNGNLYKILDLKPDSYVAVFKGKGV